jgi:hypothetical protein
MKLQFAAIVLSLVAAALALVRTTYFSHDLVLRADSHSSPFLLAQPTPNPSTQEARAVGRPLPRFVSYMS